MSVKALTCRFPRPDAVVRLYCFPWAGGGASFYSNWGKHIPDHIEVYGVCLPGRETRFKDPVCNNLSQILDEVTSAILSSCKGKPFAFWGHSMGALLTYEVARILKLQHNIEPVHMFVSGISAPHSEKRKKTTLNVREYSKEEFIELMRKLGGTPKEILENKDMMDIFVPPLRADYELIPQFSYDTPASRSAVFSCPVDVFDGKDDIEHDLQGWKDITTGSFSITMIDGQHFYLKEDYNTIKLCNYINLALSGCSL
ncbi:hypothetical protein ACF0H5_010871 [Mactra antiquata]